MVSYPELVGKVEQFPYRLLDPSVGQEHSGLVGLLGFDGQPFIQVGPWQPDIPPGKEPPAQGHNEPGFLDIQAPIQVVLKKETSADVMEGMLPLGFRALMDNDFVSAMLAHDRAHECFFHEQPKDGGFEQFVDMFQAGMHLLTEHDHQGFGFGQGRQAFFEFEPQVRGQFSPIFTRPHVRYPFQTKWGPNCGQVLQSYTLTRIPSPPG